MKKNTHKFVLLFFIFCAVTSCQKKRDDTAVVAPTQADFEGIWNVTSGCFNYKMTITASGSRLTMTYLHKDFTVLATASNTSMNITAGNYSSPSGDSYYFSGTGTLNTPTSLTITYTTKDNTGTPLNCTANCTK